MKSSISDRIVLPGLLLVLGVTMSACDFQAATDAFEEFQIVIGLDPINSPVSAVVYDKNTGDPLDATLTFWGSGATSLIDAYSDPLDTVQDVEGGLLTFGISNAITPSEISPFSFTVTATAPGYLKHTRTIAATEVGGLDFEMTMSREPDGTSVVQGSSAVLDASLQTDQSGVVQQAVTVQTQTDMQNNAQAVASVTIAPGTVALTSSGQPLTGQIQTEMRAYDSAEGYTNLPQEITLSQDGVPQPVMGAVYLKMSDANGNVASSFSSSTAGKTQVVSPVLYSKAAGACLDAGGFFELIIEQTDPLMVGAVQYRGQPLDVYIRAWTSADNQTSRVGTTQLFEFGGKVYGVLCSGGALNNIDWSKVGDISRGGYFYFYPVETLLDAPELSHRVTLVNPSSSPVSGNIVLSGGGGTGQYSQRFYVDANESVEMSLSWWAFLREGQRLLHITFVDFVVTATADGGDPVAVSISDASSGSSTITLSPPPSAVAYTLNASFTCPANTSFDVSASAESLDGVSMMYRMLPNGSPRIIPKDENLLITTDESTFISVSTVLGAMPGSEYRFTGVLANERSSIDVTAPTGTSTWNVELDSDDVGFSCN